MKSLPLYFNTSGPCRPERHYMLPSEPRLPEARELIDEGQYFVVHAPRQTGKTTTLGHLAQTLTSEGRYAAVWLTCEAAGVVDDFAAAEEQLLDRIRLAAAEAGLAEESLPPDPWPDAAPGQRIRAGLSAWTARSPFPLVLFFDEIDALHGASLVGVLRQLRDGRTSLAGQFPHSVVLCGLRDVRDYKAAAGGDPARLGTASPFNVSVKSLRIGDFSFDQVAELYGQHTSATGQVFTPEALQRAFEASQGQPWLVNALAREVVREMRIPAPEPITDGHMELAVEQLIKARATHLDSLVARLHEPRVKRVVEPLIAGTLPVTDVTYSDDLAYLRDLGLISRSRTVQIANPIYQEVILRVLAEHAESVIDLGSRSFITPDGRLDLPKLLAEFLAFWRLHGDLLATTHTYHEVACQLVFMGFLHRVVNGGGYIDREYGVGTGRIDCLVRWPYAGPDGERLQQWEAVELKAWHHGRADPLNDGLAQLDTYLDRFGLKHGTLVIFDRRKNAPPIHERTTITHTRTPTGKDVTLVYG